MESTRSLLGKPHTYVVSLKAFFFGVLACFILACTLANVLAPAPTPAAKSIVIVR